MFHHVGALAIEGPLNLERLSRPVDLDHAVGEYLEEHRIGLSDPLIGPEHERVGFLPLDTRFDSP